MTTKERFERIYAHKEADRVPVMDYPWSHTVLRWREEGLPSDDWQGYFGLDRIAGIHADISPQYEWSTVEETDDYIITATNMGSVVKNFKHSSTTPENISFKVKDRATWAEAKARMQPDKGRINWEFLAKNYKEWVDEGYWISAGLWFGFDVAHSRLMGTETFLMLMLDDPELCMDIFDTHLNLSLAMLDMAWDAGYRFHEVSWADDMGYKGTQFFSLPLYRELLKPFQKRAVDWAHQKGCVVRLHSCGKIDKFIPDFIEIGIDALNPIEVKAGNDPVAIKRQYGNELVLHGGINALLWDDAWAITEEIKRILPVLKQNGGYIFSSDHSIPSAVSFDNFKKIIATVIEYGAY